MVIVSQGLTPHINMRKKQMDIEFLHLHVFVLIIDLIIEENLYEAYSGSQYANCSTI